MIVRINKYVWFLQSLCEWGVGEGESCPECTINHVFLIRCDKAAAFPFTGAVCKPALNRIMNQVRQLQTKDVVARIPRLSILPIEDLVFEDSFASRSTGDLEESHKPW